jgi:hypothetical protein
MDLNYYYWPGAWVQNRPGMFTGSGFPQRFADSDGSLIDVYQATTQMTDESNIDVALHVKTLLDHALGPQGYYGTFAANMHTDNPDNPGADAIVSEATSRGVPVISAAQMLTWLDGRNGSSFSGLSFTSNQLSFSIQPGAGAAGLRAMLPVNGPTGRLNGLFRGGAAVPVSFETIKGVEYATFDAVGGSYVATFGSPPPPPPPAGGGTPPPGPTATPRSPSPTAVPPSVTAPAPRAAVSPRRVRQSLGGAVRLRVACPTGVTSCRVTLTLKVGQRTIGRTALTVRGGASRLATVKLSAWARGRLALHRTLTATAVALSRDPAGRGVTTRTRIQLLAPKRNGR